VISILKKEMPDNWILNEFKDLILRIAINDEIQCNKKSQIRPYHDLELLITIDGNAIEINRESMKCYYYPTPYHLINRKFNTKIKDADIKKINKIIKQVNNEQEIKITQFTLNIEKKQNYFEACCVPDHGIYIHMIIRNITKEIILKRRIEELEGQLSTVTNNRLPTKSYELLKFIRERNDMGIKPSYIETIKFFKISYQTLTLRINNLLQGNNIIIEQEGRRKLLSITEKGKALFKK
jgi:hypothetical protein